MESSSFDDSLSFNFWPSFADAMVAFVLILVLLLIYVVFNGFFDLGGIQQKQEAMTQDIEANYGGRVVEVQRGNCRKQYVIRRGGREEIEICNDLQLQRISFRGNILFPQNEYRLSEGGRQALTSVGRAIKNQLSAIQQIQIEGHTDILPTDRYEEGNLELGALRAISVFRFLQEDSALRISPVENLMSVTSYGQYKPVQRNEALAYNTDSLGVHNETLQHRSQNRRIELLLFYTSEDGRSAN